MIAENTLIICFLSTIETFVKNDDFYKEHKDRLNKLAHTIQTKAQDLDEGKKHG